MHREFDIAYMCSDQNLLGDKTKCGGYISVLVTTPRHWGQNCRTATYADSV